LIHLPADNPGNPGGIFFLNPVCAPGSILCPGAKGFNLPGHPHCHRGDGLRATDDVLGGNFPLAVIPSCEQPRNDSFFDFRTGKVSVAETRAGISKRSGLR